MAKRIITQPVSGVLLEVNEGHELKPTLGPSVDMYYYTLMIQDEKTGEIHRLKVPKDREPNNTSLDEVLEAYKLGERVEFSGEVNIELYQKQFSFFFRKETPISREYEGRFSVGGKNYGVHYTVELDDTPNLFSPSFQIDRI